MAKMLINDSTLTAIADAIRAKNETSETMLPGEMAALIAAIKTGAPLPDWITEIDFVKGSVSSIVQTMSVPTTLSAAPTGFWIVSNSSSGVSGKSVFVMTAKSSFTSITAGVSSGGTGLFASATQVNASFSDGTVTFSIGGGTNSLYFVNSRIHSIVMWR